MTNEPGEPATDGDPEVSRARSPWVKRGLVAGVAIVVVLVAFIGVTGATGFPAPGWMERFPYGDLSDLASAINAEAGDLRTPDDCWRTVPEQDGERRDPNGPLREIARVDYLRSRVVVRAYASSSGEIDRATYRSITDRLDKLFGANPQYSWEMVKIEASPDGWSPLVSCRLVTRGWVHAPEAEDLLEEARQTVLASLQAAAAEGATDFETVRRHARKSLGKFIGERTRRRPMVIPVVMEV